MASQDPKPKLFVLNPLAVAFEPKREVSYDAANRGTGLAQTSDATPVIVSDPKPLTEFHPFSRLPVELKVKIWKLHRPDPRIVELRYSKKIYHAVSPTPAPVLLHVCREVSFLVPEQHELSSIFPNLFYVELPRLIQFKF